MKNPLPLLLLALTGCQSPAPEPVPLPAPVPPMPYPVPARPAERNETERRQAQIIEALINQNEALTQRLASARPAIATPPERRMDRPTPPIAEKPFLVPNAEGVIDLRAREGKADEPVNPFEVPRAGDGKGREVALVVSGIIAGAETCAVINERTVTAGDVIETLTVESIAREGVFLVAGERRMRLPVSETPVRVRLPD